MPRPSKRVRNAAAQTRLNGRYKATTDPPFDVDMQFTEDKHCDTIDCTFFEDWWESETEKNSPGSYSAAKRPKVYTGDSDRTKRRKQSANAFARRQCPMEKLTEWLIPIQQSKVSSLTASDCIRKLKILFDGSKKSNGHHFIQVCVLLKFFELRSSGFSRNHSSQEASKCLPSTLSRHFRTIQNWARCFDMTSQLPLSRKGKHQKTSSLIMDKMCCQSVPIGFTCSPRTSAHHKHSNSI